MSYWTRRVLLFLSVAAVACAETNSESEPLTVDLADAQDVVGDAVPESTGSPDAADLTPDASGTLDPTPVPHCTDDQDQGVRGCQAMCKVCLDLPPLGSVAEVPAPSVAPFERVTWLEEQLNDPIFAIGDFQMLTSALAMDVNADGHEDLLVTARAGVEGITGPVISRVAMAAPDGTLGPASPLAMGEPSLAVLSAADLDGDGRRDLVGTTNDGIVIVWNTPLGFVDNAALVTVLPPPAGVDESVPLSEVVYTVTVMDLEGDGDTDVLVAMFGAPNQVLRNEGDRAFTDVTETIGLADTGALTFFLAPFAWDPDVGLSGIFVANDGMNAANHAYQLPTDGAGAAAALEPIPGPCDGVRMAMCDAMVGSPCGPDLFDNMMAMAGQGATGSIGLGTFSGAGVTRPMGMGCLYHQGATPLCVMGQTDSPAPDYVAVHTGDGTWGLAAGVLDLPKPRTTGGHIAVSWAVLPFDDGDGLEDLVIATGDNEEFHTLGSSPTTIMVLQNFLGESLDPERGDSRVAAYRGLPDGRFEEVGDGWGLDGRGHYATVAPIWLTEGGVPLLHLIVGGFGQAFEVYRLTHPRGRLLRLRLRGTEDNPDGIGARIEVLGGERTWTRWVGWESAQIRLGNLHQSTTVGVGELANVDAVVRWPNGLEERFESLAADGHERLLVQGQGVPATPRP